MCDQYYGCNARPGDGHPQETIRVINVYNSEFYRSYENTLRQARGKIVHPTLN